MKNPIDDLTWLLLVALVAIWVCASAEAAESYEDLIYRQFEIYDPEYQRHREQYGERLHAMAEAIAAAVGLSGHDPWKLWLSRSCSPQCALSKIRLALSAH